MFNPAKKIIIKIDTNKIALGLILSQPDKKTIISDYILFCEIYSPRIKLRYTR